MYILRGAFEVWSIRHQGIDQAKFDQQAARISKATAFPISVESRINQLFPMETKLHSMKSKDAS